MNNAGLARGRWSEGSTLPTVDWMRIFAVNTVGPLICARATWVVGFASGDIPQIPLNQVLLNDRTVIGIDWGYWAGLRPDANTELLDELFAMVRDGKLRPAQPTTYRLDDAARALDDLEHRRIAGKVVLAPQE